MLLNQWSQKWGISPDALADLQANYLGQRSESAHSVAASMSEASVSQRVELAFAELGGILWRNNVGVLPDLRGVPVRYGLANTSKKVNSETKSGDLIGCLPVVIQSHHVGHTLGLFVSIETKRANWTWKGNKHEQAQANWGQIVTSLGGVGMFCNDPSQIEALRSL